MKLFGVLAIAAVDYVVYRVRRARALERYRRNPLRLETMADTAAVDALFERAGREPPAMADWVRLAHATARPAAESEASPAPGPAGAAGAEAPPESMPTQATTRSDAERYEQVRELLARHAPGARTVVDVGANDGEATATYGVGADGFVVGVDVSHPLLVRFRRRLPVHAAVVGDGARLPLADACADALFCTETLEHVPSPGAAVAEFVRVLRPGGVFVVQSPNAHRLRNLNPFHVVELALSVFTDRVLQKKVVHENTWHNAVTYHWDFSVRDYRRMAREAGAEVVAIVSRDVFVPRTIAPPGSGRARALQRLLLRVPVVRLFGGDLVMVARRPPEADAR